MPFSIFKLVTLNDCPLK